MGEICMFREICVKKEMDPVDLLMIERKRNWEREKEGKRSQYGVRRINTFWTEEDNGRKLMVGKGRAGECEVLGRSKGD